MNQPKAAAKKGGGSPARPSGEAAAAAGAARGGGASPASGGASPTRTKPPRSAAAPDHGPAREEEARDASAAAAASPDRASLPGAYHVAGPNFPVADEHTEATGSNSLAAIDGGSAPLVLEGYVPEPTPEELRDARIRREAEEMLRSAVALDPSAVRVIESDGEDERALAKGGEGIVRKCLKSPLSAVFLTVALLLAVALGVVFGTGGESGSADESSQPVEPCTIESVQERYEVARSIVSEITPLAVLDDETSPQARALEWVVCNDTISSDLIDSRDQSSGILPNQTWGTFARGNAGEIQVLRRYILATFHYATSEDGPWDSTLNFLSGDRHECTWHENRTRPGFPYREYEPVGVVCLNATQGGRPFFLMLDDAEQQIGKMNLHIRRPNNLTGIIPPELGHLIELSTIGLVNQKGLRGSLPSTLGNLVHLDVFALIGAGPEIGGTIPASLFSPPEINVINMLLNEGSWELPPDIEPHEENKLFSIGLRSNNLKGTLPPYFSKLKGLQRLEVSDNHFEGSIPDSYGDLPSLQYLNAHGNDLNGTLPQSLGQLANVVIMFLGKNHFQGPLPTSLGNLSKLELLDLGHNELEGTVPASFSRLTNLEHISLQNNSDLYGPISAFESLPSLSSLALCGNGFSSTIPADLFSRSAGKNLIAGFGHNNFTGGLPPALSQQASSTSYLAIMRNSFDADVVGDAICEEVPVLYADCNSCTCCQFCCSEDSEDANDPNCNYMLDFYNVVGLKYQCLSRGLPTGIKMVMGCSG